MAAAVARCNKNCSGYASSTTAAAAAAVAILVALALTGPRDAECIRILAVESIAGKSHWNFMRAVLRALTDNGHEVTAFTPFPDGDRQNYTEVDLSTVFPIKLDMEVSTIFDQFADPMTLVPLTTQMSRMLCDLMYDNDRMQDVLSARPDDLFDLIIIEPLASDCVSYVASTLRVPMIFVVPSPMITHAERAYLGHVPNPATVSHMLASHGVPRTFVQRFGNAVLLAYSTFAVKYTEWTLKRAEPKPYDFAPPVQPSAVFVNTHFITEAPRPMPPNVVQVGGVHLEQPKGIPSDVLKFIEESPNGVIYFTFGSVVKMSTMPDNVQKAFKEALAQVPQRILWKFEGVMEDIPNNVMIKNWFPQRDILLHPNIKLFISHGGISGIYETVDAGVPVLGFPLFYDQHRNIANLVDAGMAISMELLSVTKDTFLNSISDLINNEKYLKNAKITSQRFKDRPMSPEKSIVYWTEYIHRHNGAEHLKSYALNLAWYQYFLLDVIFVMLILISIVLFLSYTVLRLIYNYSLTRLQYFKHKSE